MQDQDPRLQPGAYITDGIDLYEVMAPRRLAGPMGVITIRIAVENCRSLRMLEFLPDRIRSAFELVRHAPVGLCPDRFDEIAWEAAPERRLALERG